MALEQNSIRTKAHVLFETQNKLHEAELLFRRALEGCEETLGLKHEDTLTSVNDLAILLEDQGKYDEAELLYKRVLEGDEEMLGPNHHTTLNTKGNLGHCLMLQNNPLGREMVVDAFNKLQQGPNGVKASHPWYTKFTKILNGEEITIE